MIDLAVTNTGAIELIGKQAHNLHIKMLKHLYV